MGAFVGDAAGAHVEFRRNVEAKDVEQGLKLEGGGPFRTGKGQVTDDSEMALAIFHALCRYI